jgi:hypothetical protein
MTVNKQNKWKFNTLSNKERMENVGTVLKKILQSSATHCHSKHSSGTDFEIFSGITLTIGQYVSPSAENVNITEIFSFDDPCSTEFTFLAPFVARIRPVDGHIWKPASSQWKL